MTPSSDDVRRAEHLANLTNLIHSSQASFSGTNTLEKQIWSNEELSARALQLGLTHAQRQLEQAMKRKLGVLEVEVQKLKRALREGSHQLEARQEKSINSMKGDICVMVHQRWSLEEQTKGMTGEGGQIEGAQVERARVERARVESTQVEGTQVEGARVEGAQVDENVQSRQQGDYNGGFLRLK